MDYASRIKLYVSFAKEPYKRGNILQNRPMILKGPTHQSLPIASRECDKGIESHKWITLAHMCLMTVACEISVI